MIHGAPWRILDVVDMLPWYRDHGLEGVRWAHQHAHEHSVRLAKWFGFGPTDKGACVIRERWYWQMNASDAFPELGGGDPEFLGPNDFLLDRFLCIASRELPESNPSGPRPVLKIPEMPKPTCRWVPLNEVTPFLRTFAACDEYALPYCLGRRRECGLSNFLQAVAECGALPGMHLTDVYNYGELADVNDALYYAEKAGLLRNVGRTPGANVALCNNGHTAAWGPKLGVTRPVGPDPGSWSDRSAVAGAKQGLPPAAFTWAPTKRLKNELLAVSIVTDGDGRPVTYPTRDQFQDGVEGDVDFLRAHAGVKTKQAERCNRAFEDQFRKTMRETDPNRTPKKKGKKK